jgi:hypothetical protein
VVSETSVPYTLHEGNRRVTAPKGLLDPDAVPARTVRVKRLLNRYDDAEIPTGIRVKFAPNMPGAQPLLARQRLLRTAYSSSQW